MPLYTPTAYSGTAGPADHGLSAWAYDPALCISTSILTNGTIYLVKLVNVPAATVTKVYWHVAAVGVTATSGQNFVGLYDSTGARLATTNVDADITSTGLKATTITGQALTPGASCYVGLVFNAGTAPTLARGTGITGVSALGNAGLSASGFRFATNATTQTSLPASVTLASNVGAPFPLWVAIGA